MNEIDLQDSMCDLLRDIFAGYQLLNKGGNLQEVQIFAQYVPQPAGITIHSRENTGLKNYTDTDYESNFPCIVAILNECEDREERRIDASTVKMTLLFCVYDDAPECQGYRDLLNMQERVRNYLLVNRIVNNRFRLEMPVKTRLIPCETWPVYFGEMDLIFQSGRPSMPKSFVFEHNPINNLSNMAAHSV